MGIFVQDFHLLAPVELVPPVGHHLLQVAGVEAVVEGGSFQVRDRHVLPPVEAPQSCPTSATAVLMPSHPTPPFTDPLSKSAAQSVAFPQEQPQVAWRVCGLRKSLWDIAMNLSSIPIHKGW
uniref:Uncharacterized protein n=1 Tax=Accipiter nisus TaxID=211598 RepID=A0A8B9M556_9AVES